MPVRKYLTHLLWPEDRLSSLSSRSLVSLILLCGLVLSTIALGTIQFLDDLAYLLAENDLMMALIVLQSLLVISAALWVLSCCAGALARRVLLRLRGL